MTAAEKQALLQKLENARAELEDMLPRVDPAKEIYPGWTIRQFLAHMTGWDDANIASLRAHAAGHVPATPADLGINAYNAQTVTSRQDLDLEHITKEWRLTRRTLRTIVDEMAEEKFKQPLIVPWGGTGTVTSLLEVFIEHEEEHAGDLKRWLENPDRILEKEGK
jgi:hypothetical protein